MRLLGSLTLVSVLMVGVLVYVLLSLMSSLDVSVYCFFFILSLAAMISGCLGGLHIVFLFLSEMWHRLFLSYYCFYVSSCFDCGCCRGNFPEYFLFLLLSF